MPGVFEIYEDKAGEFRFRLKASNGEKMLASEGYTRKSSAEGGVASVKENAPDDARYEKRTSSGGSPYFVLKGANHEVIGTSELYSSASARDDGIDAVKRAAPGASVVGV